MKKFIQYIVVLVLLASLAGAVVWANYQQGLQLCRDIKVRIVNEDAITFVTKRGILRDLEDMNMSPVGMPMSKINTQEIERRLSKSEYLEGVECYFDNANELVIEARQLVPVMRVFDGDKSYYVNREGKRMSALGRYHVDVPVVEGHFSGSFQPTALIPMMDYVAKDDALSSLVTMYLVKDSCNICFVPSICGHIVNMGDGKDYESKFAKLMLFYKKVMPDKGWNTYSEISLKWDYQVVATLKNKAQLAEAVYNPDEDEIAPDLASIQVDQIQQEMKTGQKIATEEPKSEEPSKSVKEDKKPVKNGKTVEEKSTNGSKSVDRSAEKSKNTGQKTPDSKVKDSFQKDKKDKKKRN